MHLSSFLIVLKLWLGVVLVMAVQGNPLLRCQERVPKLNVERFCEISYPSECVGDRPAMKNGRSLCPEVLPHEICYLVFLV